MPQKLIPVVFALSLIILATLATASSGSESAIVGSGFTLKKQVTPPFYGSRRTLDINLGESPTDFAAACWWQLTGEHLSPAEVQSWAAKLGTPEAPRRIDLALLMAQKASVTPDIYYSDPWEKQIPLQGVPERKVKRQIGAAMMFFFNCPGLPNGSPHWCNNHAPGMVNRAEIWGFGPKRDGFYNPANPGFWYREFKDATFAGLNFLLLDCYGPDWQSPIPQSLTAGWNKLKSESADEPVKIGLFDDTWTWGKPYFGPFWKNPPDLSKTDEAAKTIYEAKWKPFYQGIPKDSWFNFGSAFHLFLQCQHAAPQRKHGSCRKEDQISFCGRFWSGTLCRCRQRVFYMIQKCPKSRMQNTYGCHLTHR